jgi:hypothetical protein
VRSKSFLAALWSCVGVCALTGCVIDSSKASSEEAKGSPQSPVTQAQSGTAEKESATISLGPDGLKFNASDGKGAKAKIDLGPQGVKVDAQDGKGGGAKIDASGDEVKINAEGDGASFVNNVRHSEEQMGLPFYPRAVLIPVASTRSVGKQEIVLTDVRSTQDGLDKVAEFYGGRTKGFTQISSITNGVGQVEFSKEESSGEKLAMKAERQEGTLTTITLVRARPRQ